MNIIFFEFGPLEQAGGTEKYFIDTTNGLKSRHPNDNITVVTMSDKYLLMLNSLLRFYYFRKLTSSDSFRESEEQVDSKLFDVKYLKVNSIHSLKLVLKTADVIYSKNEIIEIIILRLINAFKSVPIIIGIHTPLKYPKSLVFSEILHNLIYSSKFYLSSINKSAFIKVLNSDDDTYLKTKLNHPKIKKIYHPYISTESVISFNNDKALRILFIGRLTDAKGVDVALRCNQFLSNKTEYKFKFIGSGDKKLIADLEKNVKNIKNSQYLGHLDAKDLNVEYDWADVVIIPSRYETLCQVAIEAGSHGVIAVASNISGPKDIIINGKTGFLTEPNTKDFVTKLILLRKMKNTNQLEFGQLKQNALNHIQTNFEAEKCFSEIYDALVIAANA